MPDFKMFDENEVRIAGNLTRDPELSYTTNDAAVAKFSIAYNKRYKSKTGEQQEETHFFNCEVWGAGAEYIGKHARKGDPVRVVGALRHETWEDRKTGDKKSTVKVRAWRVDTLTWPERGEGAQAKGHSNRRPIEEPVPEDDIPF